VAFYRQAADRYVERGDTAKEGLVRNNLGDTLRRLGHFDEARSEVRRAIECKAPLGHAAAPWKTWDILVTIETHAGNPDAAASLLQQRAADPNLPEGLRPFLQPLQTIVAGSGDPPLAQTRGLSYDMAAEVLLLIETLEQAA
jgi:Tfp pilus assembly protein PilF